MENTWELHGNYEYIFDFAVYLKKESKTYHDSLQFKLAKKISFKKHSHSNLRYIRESKVNFRDSTLQTLI